MSVEKEYVPTGSPSIRLGEPPFDAEEARARLSRRLIEFYKDLYGRGPIGVRTVLSAEIATVAMHEVLTTGEQTLVAGGKSLSVESMRLRTAEITRPQLVELAEEALGVEVIASVTGIRAGDNLAIETFLLAPVARQG